MILQIKLTASSKFISDEELQKDIMDTIIQHELEENRSPMNHPKWDDEADNDQQDPEVWNEF